MEYKIDRSTKSDVIRFSLDSGDEIFVMPHSIMSKTYSLKEKIANRKTFWDKAAENEKFELTKIYSEDKSGVLTVAPKYSGSVNKLEPTDEKLLISSNSFLVSDSNININLNKKEFFMGSSLNALIVDNITNIFVSSCEGMITIELGEKQQTVINQDYLIAFDMSIDYQKINENSTTHILKGPGKIYLHSRVPQVED